MDAFNVLSKRGNNALRVNGNTVNGATAQIAETTQGSDFYYAICAVMGTVALSIMAASVAKPRTDRIFFYITAAINLTACIAYFSMGSNLGFTPIAVEFHRPVGSKVAGEYREVFYARYIDWVITTPLLIMDLLLTAGLPWPTILWTIFLDEIMIVTGLCGALTATRYKWGYWSFGTAAMFAIFWIIGFEGRKHAKNLGSDVYRCYLLCGVLTLVVWLCYPIAWGVSEGGNVITPDGEAVFYGVLDFCAKPIFSIALIIGHWGINPGRLGLKLRDYDEEPDYFGAKNKSDRKAQNEASDGVHNGVHNGADTV